MTTTSARRVTDNTADSHNQRIDRDTAMRVAYFEAHPEQIKRRLAELDREWDVERVVETNSSLLTLAGLLLGVTRGRKWLLLSLAIQGFFLQHALQGWCPPIPLLRRLGVRTQHEIEQERYALKALRGDFRPVSLLSSRGKAKGNGGRADQAMDAVRD